SLHTFFDQVVELIQFWKDNDPCSSVLGSTFSSFVGIQWNIVTSTGSCHSLWLNSELFLKYTYHRGSTLHRKIPVVLKSRVADRHIISVSFNHEFDLWSVLNYLCHFSKNFLGA